MALPPRNTAWNFEVASPRNLRFLGSIWEYVVIASSSSTFPENRRHFVSGHVVTGKARLPSPLFASPPAPCPIFSEEAQYSSVKPSGEIRRLIVPDIRHGSEIVTYPPHISDSHIDVSQTPAASLFAAPIPAYSMNTFAGSLEPVVHRKTQQWVFFFRRMWIGSELWSKMLSMVDWGGAVKKSCGNTDLIHSRYDCMTRRLASCQFIAIWRRA